MIDEKEIEEMLSDIKETLAHYEPLPEDRPPKPAEEDAPEGAEPAEEDPSDGAEPADPAEAEAAEEAAEECRRQARYHLELAYQYWQAAGEQGDLPSRFPPEDAEAAEESPPSPSKPKRRWVNELIFYLVLVLIVVGTFVAKSGSGDTPITMGGYSVFTVLTGSMQKEIPQGSLIITKREDPSALQIGDTITYMANQTTVVTHQIVGIIENYLDTGARAFETQGVMNDLPDKLPVPAVNVIGKVIFHNYALGRVATFVSNYWMYLLIFPILFVGLAVALKTFFRKT